MAQFPALVTEINHNIAIVRLDRPAQRNSLSVATLTELAETVSSLGAKRDITALILTGTADVFASGADLSELEKLDPEAALKFALFGQSVFQSIADCKFLTVAAINGYCMGGGLDLALACDIRVASESAVFAHPGAKRGIITGWGGTQRLPRLIGRSRSLELFVTARMVTSDDALRLGLITRIGDPVLELAVEVTKRAVSTP